MTCDDDGDCLTNLDDAAIGTFGKDDLGDDCVIVGHVDHVFADGEWKPVRTIFPHALWPRRQCFLCNEDLDMTHGHLCGDYDGPADICHSCDRADRYHYVMMIALDEARLALLRKEGVRRDYRPVGKVYLTAIDADGDQQFELKSDPLKLNQKIAQERVLIKWLVTLADRRHAMRHKDLKAASDLVRTFVRATRLDISLQIQMKRISGRIQPMPLEAQSNANEP